MTLLHKKIISATILPVWINVIVTWFDFCVADKAKDMRTNKIVALKKMRMENEKDGKLNRFPN